MEELLAVRMWVDDGMMGVRTKLGTECSGRHRVREQRSAGADGLEMARVADWN
jgi:hypothetical protein